MRRSASLLVTLVCLTLVGCGLDDPSPTRDGPARTGARLADAPVEPGTTLQQITVAPELTRAMTPDGPAVAAGPREVAAQLQVARTTLRDPGATAEQLAAAGHLQQVALLELGPRPRWDARVYAALPAEAHADLRDDLASRRAFLRLHGGTQHRTLPAWRIVAPEPVEQLRAHYDLAEQRYGVPWSTLAAINLVETGMGRIRGASYAGARGPMQFMPQTWAAYGRGDIESPRDSILAAGRYLQAMGFARDRDRALFRYNNSRDYVTGVERVARVLDRDPAALAGYHGWQVYYATARGSVRLPQGYAERRPVRLRDWLATPEGQASRPLRAAPR